MRGVGAKRIKHGIMLTEEEKNAAHDALRGSSGFIRKLLGQKMIIRALPELTFVLDESIEYGSYMTKKIEELTKKS